MSCLASKIRLPSIFVAALSAGLLAQSQAHAACAVLEGQATAPNQQMAEMMAQQDALQKIMQSTAGQVVENIEYQPPGCFYLDDGTNNISCQVQAAFCTQPPRPGGGDGGNRPARPRLPEPGEVVPLPGFPNDSAQVPRGGGGCADFSASATGRSLKDAQNRVRGALEGALRSRRGVSLGAGGVSVTEPMCYYLDNGTDQAHCEQTARVCG